MKGCKSITNLDTDLSTGERLIELLGIYYIEYIIFNNINIILKIYK